jgi:hypothetical protein
VIEGTQDARVATAAAPALDGWDQWNYARSDALVESASARHLSQDIYGASELDRHGTWQRVETYGSVWVPRGVPADWAPYSTGTWISDPHYGWTWVDSAPWGWAPYHYGRWVYVRGVWAWAPGPVVVRPVYAPALVAFFGPPVRVGVGPLVGWCALGWGEPVVPWWGRRGYAGVPSWRGWGGPRVVNKTVVHNTTVIDARQITVYENSRVKNAVVVVKEDDFGGRRVAGRRVARDNDADIRPVAAPPADRVRPASLVPETKADVRPARDVTVRPVVTRQRDGRPGLWSRDDRPGNTSPTPGAQRDDRDDRPRRERPEQPARLDRPDSDPRERDRERDQAGPGRRDRDDRDRARSADPTVTSPRAPQPATPAPATPDRRQAVPPAAGTPADRDDRAGRGRQDQPARIDRPGTDPRERDQAPDPRPTRRDRDDRDRARSAEPSATAPRPSQPATPPAPPAPDRRPQAPPVVGSPADRDDRPGRGRHEQPPRVDRPGPDPRQRDQAPGPRPARPDRDDRDRVRSAEPPTTAPRPPQPATPSTSPAPDRRPHAPPVVGSPTDSRPGAVPTRPQAGPAPDGADRRNQPPAAEPRISEPRTPARQAPPPPRNEPPTASQRRPESAAPGARVPDPPRVQATPAMAQPEAARPRNAEPRQQQAAPARPSPPAPERAVTAPPRKAPELRSLPNLGGRKAAPAPRPQAEERREQKRPERSQPDQKRPQR